MTSTVTMPTTDDAVLLADAAEEEAADAVDVEDALGDDGAAHQRADVGADEGDDRDEGVAQGVHGRRSRSGVRPLATAVRT